MIQSGAAQTVALEATVTLMTDALYPSTSYGNAILERGSLQVA